MIRELLLEDLSLWACAWQSTSFALIGLVGGFLLRRRPARASQLLLLGLIAAVTVPAMGTLVRHFELGVLVAEPIEREVQMSHESVPAAHETSASLPIPVNTMSEVQTTVVKPVLAEAGSESVDIPWRLIALCGWLTASLVFLGRLLFAVVGGVCLMRRAQPTACDQIKRAAESVGSGLAIAGKLRLRSSGRIRSPVIWCWSNPAVLIVPNDLNHKVDWSGVIRHELAHCRRKDHLTGLIAELAVCVLPWNPLLWWSKRRMVRFSEQACDDWVVAGGQSREDYAQSLLDFKPQKHAAFVPAVVSSARPLAGRVRRILTGGHSDPRTGTAWALAVTLVVICLGAGIAFAQVRSSHSTATVKTRVGQSAAIEEPAFATTMIKGRILDSNDEPAYGARVVALPVTSWGYRTEHQGRNKEGYFELPWSPTWIDEGQPIHLIATTGNQRAGSLRYEAAVIEVLDPTQPVTVRLEPTTLSIEGVVLDPDGRSLEHYTATVSFPTEFRCRAPILATDVWSPRVRMSLTVPYGPKYKLAIQAEGFRTKRLTVDATDRSKKTIDVGTILLERHDSAKPVATEEYLSPDLAKEFHEIYQLEEHEVLKFVKAPLVLGRQEYLHSLNGSNVFPLGLQVGSMQVGLTWDGKLKMRSGHGTTSPSLKHTVLRLMLDMPYYDFNIPGGLNIRLPHGDWIVRHESPLAEQLAALEDILLAESGRSIRFEKRAVEREVIIAKGRYEFRSHPSGNYPEHVHVTFDGAFGSGSGSSNSLEQMFSRIEWEAEAEVVDETEPIEDTPIRYKMGDIRQIAREPELRSERLRALADNLAKTTSLKFKVERRPAEVWFATETKSD